MSSVITNEVFKGDTINDAWEKAFNSLSYQAESGVTNSSRDGEVVGEILNATFIVADPTRNILTSKIRNMPMRYAVGEFLWYLSGNPRLDAIGHYTKAWERMSDDGKVVNSNYGSIIQQGIDWNLDAHEFNQFDYCYDLLKQDPNTRQAVIHIKTPRDTRVNPTKDLNCTVYCQFFIRESQETPKSPVVKKLYMSTHMRSNDLWMGVPYDMFFFMNLQVIMAMKLGVSIGSYTHYAGSLHMYGRDYEVAKKNIEKENIIKKALYEFNNKTKLTKEYTV